MVEQRLQKVLAAAGVASRRKCEQMILEGAVEVNGKVVDSLPVFVDPDKDVITVDGRKIRAEPKVYFLLNKPKGVICTSSDPQSRKKAVDLRPQMYLSTESGWLFFSFVYQMHRRQRITSPIAQKIAVPTKFVWNEVGLSNQLTQNL